MSARRRCGFDSRGGDLIMEKRQLTKRELASRQRRAEFFARMTPAERDAYSRRCDRQRAALSKFGYAVL
jgi:hypothetical protein